MARGNEILLKLRAENRDLKAKISESQGKINGMEKSTKKSFGGMLKSSLGFLAAIGSIVYAFKKMITSASNLEEQQAKFNTVFGTSEEVLKAANEAVQELTDSYAMSRREAMEYLSTIQDLLVPLGMNAVEAEKMSEGIVKLSADLASFNNVPVEEAMDKILSGLVGMGRPMLEWGVQINETTLKQEALTMGLWNGVGALDGATKAQAAYSIMMRQSEAAQGDMIRTGDSYANTFKKLKAAVEDMAADLGKDLLPSLRNLFNEFIITAKGGGTFKTALQGLIKGIAAVVSGITLLAQTLEYIRTKYGDHNTEVIKSGQAYNRARMRAQEYVVMLQRYTGSQRNFVNVLKERAKYDREAATYLQNYKKIQSDLAQTGEKRLSVEGKLNGIVQRMNKTLKDFNDIGKKTTEDEIKNAQQFADLQRKKQEEMEKTNEKRKEINAAYYEYIGEQEEAELAAEIEKHERLLETYNLNNEQIEMINQAHTDRMKEIENKYNVWRMKTVELYRDTYTNAMSSMDTATKQFVFDSIWGKQGLNVWWKNVKQILKEFVADVVWATIKVLALKAALSALGGGGAPFLLERGYVPPFFEKGRVPVLQSGDIPSDHFPAYIGTREAVINAESTRANEDLLRAMNQFPGVSFTGGGNESTVVHTSIMLDGREVANVVDEHRNEKARRMGASNYGRNTVYG